MPHETNAVSALILCIRYSHASAYSVTSFEATFIGCICIFSCHLAPALLAERLVSFICYCGTQGWNGYGNKSQHRKLTLEKTEETPSAAPAGTRTCDLSVTSHARYHWAIPTPPLFSDKYALPVTFPWIHRKWSSPLSAEYPELWKTDSFLYLWNVRIMLCMLHPLPGILTC